MIERGEPGWDECGHCKWLISRGEETTINLDTEEEEVIGEFTECQHPNGSDINYGLRNKEPDLCEHFEAREDEANL